MKTTFFAICTGIFCAAIVSCIPVGGRINSSYFIYTSGDIGRTVQISYLDSDPHSSQNVHCVEVVQLPFFKKVDYNRGVRIEDDDVFLEIVSENDSTTKAAIFGYEESFADGCSVFSIWYPENAVGECAYCKELPKDSVLNYFKTVHYPCYLEFAQGETVKKVWLRDTFRWQPYE